MGFIITCTFLKSTHPAILPVGSSDDPAHQAVLGRCHGYLSKSACPVVIKSRRYTSWLSESSELRLIPDVQSSQSLFSQSEDVSLLGFIITCTFLNIYGAVD